MAGAGFELTELEQRLVEAVSSGESVHLAGTEKPDETAMKGWGADRTLRASVIRDILRGRYVDDPDPRGIRVSGAVIRGLLDLDGIRSQISLLLDYCYLPNGMCAEGASIGQLSMRGAILWNTSGPALAAEQLTVTRDVYLDMGFTAEGSGNTGAVRLCGASIGGQLSMRGAVLRNTSGPALAADGMTVTQNVYLDEVFTAEGSGEDGAVRLLGASIGGQLSMRGAVLWNTSGPAMSAARLSVTQNVYLDKGFTAVGSGKTGAVRLSRASVGGMRSDPATLTAAVDHPWSVSEFTPGGYPVGVTLAEWLRFLRRGTTEYAAGPYRDLAAAARASAHDKDLRIILRSQREHELDGPNTSMAERLWGWFTKITLGYGYQAWRTLVILMASIAAAVLLAVFAGQATLAHTKATPTPGNQCTPLERALTGVDASLPLIETGASAICGPAPGGEGHPALVAFALFQLIGWAAATLFVASYTSAVRKT